MSGVKSVAIIGLGYVGLPLAYLFTKKGFQVIGIDLDSEKVSNLLSKKSYLTDIRDQEISEMIDSGRFIPSSDYSLVNTVENIIICVPTPLRDHVPDLSYISMAAQSISLHLKDSQLIVLESSTYPGTTEEYLQPILETKQLKIGANLFLGYSPERIDPGNKDIAIEAIPKIVSGITPQCLNRVNELYRHVFEKLVPVSSPRVAEFAKMLENSQRLINISFINEINLLADKINVDLWEVIDAAKTKPMGFTPYFPGPGIGGHCIPVDPFFLSWIGMREGIPLTMIHQAGLVNEMIPHFIVSKVSRELEKEKIPFHEAKIGMIGLTYKKDVNDIRESPSLKVIELLKNQRMNIWVHDPLYLGKVPYNLQKFPLDPEIIRNFDVVLALVDHSSIPWDQVVQYSQCFIDTKNVTQHITGQNIIRL